MNMHLQIFLFYLSFFSSFSSFAHVPLQSIINVQPFILIFAIACAFIIDHNHRAHIQSYSNTTMHCHTLMTNTFMYSLYHNIQPPPHTIPTTTFKYHHNHHHHTVQVAMCAYSFVRTLVNALVLQGITPPAQVAAGPVMTTMTASGVFSLVGGRKTPPVQVAQCQHHLGHKYRSGMQQPNAA